MSDGSAALYQRNPDTFKIENTLQVKSGESPINCLNELECVGDSIYTNVLGSNFIVKIDKNTGRTVGAIDASSLLPKSKSDAEAYGVLNGIAHDPETGSFYLIGKIGQSFLKSENRKIVARESLFETVFHDSR